MGEVFIGLRVNYVIARKESLKNSASLILFGVTQEAQFAAG